MEDAQPIVQIDPRYKRNAEPTVEEMATTRQMLIHIGVPTDLAMADKFMVEGGKVIIFSLAWEDVTSLEKFVPSVPARFEWWRWEADEKVRQNLWQRLHTLVGGQLGTVPNSPKHREAFEKFCKMFARLCELQNFDTSSAEFLQKDNLPTKNAMKNFRWLEDGDCFDDVKDILKDHSAFVVAAGPSLNSLIPAIKAIRTKEKPPALICAGRTYRLLSTHGIMPDFVLEVEMFNWDNKIWTFAPPPEQDVTLAFPLVVSPEVVKDWPSRRLALPDLNIQAMFPEDLKNGMPGGNSVLHWMMNLAIYLGCDPITLIGADLGYPAGSKDTHAEGTFHPWPAKIQKTEHTYQDVLWAEANNGAKIQSSPAYINFKTLAEIIITKSGKKFRNASLNGLKIDGCEVVDLTKEV